MKGENQKEEERYWHIPSSEKVLSQLGTEPISDTDRSYFEEMVDCDRSAMENDCEADLHRKRSVFSQLKEAAHLKLEQNAWKSAEAELSLKGVHQSSLLLLFIYTFGFLACFGGEYAFTWLTFPFLLDLRGGSFLAVILALGPSTGLFALDLVFERFIENPWQEQRAGANVSTLQRWIREIVMVFFCLTILTCNFYMVLLLAEVREESSRDQEILLHSDTSQELQLDRGTLKKAIMVISLTISLDAAIFLMLGKAEWRKFRDGRRAKSALLKLLSEQKKLESELIEAASKLTAWDIVLASASERAKACADSFRMEKLLLFDRTARRLEPTVSPKPVTEVVDRTLAGFPDPPRKGFSR